VAKNYSKDISATSAATSVGFDFGLVLVLLMVLVPAKVIVYRNRQKQLAAVAALQPKGQDDHLNTDYKDNSDYDNDDDGVELSSSSYKDNPRKARHVPLNMPSTVVIPP
jgi:hypothetical protein